VVPVTTMFVATSSQPPGTELAAPWSLTASDGSGLVLTRVDAKAVVEGPLAFTELQLYFHNPEPRIREGTFAITLPTGAAVSRFAMESNGQFMEAEVVEKQLARRAYEDFLHRRQDPALLEKAEGNQFSARVFPIPASGDKHLVISFSQEVSPGHYALPLRGLARADRVDVRVQVRGATEIVEQTLSERNWLPDRDVVVDATALGVPTAIATGEFAAARLKIDLATPPERPAAVTLLVDTSASRALGFASQAHTVRALVEQLGRAYGSALPVQVVAFDQVTAPVFRGTAGQASAIEPALIARGALGASDLGQALTWLAGHAPSSRVVVVSDGVITAGAKPEALAALAKRLADRGVERIDMALTGGIRDDQAAIAVTRAGLRRTGAILDLDRGVGDAVRRLGLAVATGLQVSSNGARWVFPSVIAAAQAGDEFTIFLRRGVLAQQLTLGIAGNLSTLPTAKVNSALLGRAVAAAEIAEIEGQLATASDPAIAARLREDIVKRALVSRLVSSQTSLLVLESDADYRRFGIDRRSQVDILTIGPTGVELRHPASPALIAAPQGAQTADRAKAKDTASDVKEAKADKKLAGRADQASDRGAIREEKATNRAPEPTSDAVRGSVTGAAPGAAAGSGAGAVGGAPPREQARTAAPADLPAPRPASAEPAPPPPPAPPVRSSPPAISRGAAGPDPAHSLGVSPPQIASESERRPARDGNDDGLDANRRKPALHGPLAEIEQALAAGQADAALARARDWHSRAPGDVLALIGLGDALEAKRDLETAARAYGSIIDLFPARADFRRFAGQRLERLGKVQRALVIDSYQRAVEQRPDHLTGHRMLAYALLRDGQYPAAWSEILAAIDRHYPANRFAGAERVLADDVGMIGAAYIAHGGSRDAVLAELSRRGLELATRPSTRFIMYWETDNNDVDFHIRDARGGHAWYSHKQLASGGELYADITTGYGPECFAIPGTPTAGPYRLSINYYSQGPMGYGMGLLQIQKFDGKGNLSFEDRPYVIMTDQAFVDLGTYR
jgi:tetratricopeptide (TPR) repeat protein